MWQGGGDRLRRRGRGYSDRLKRVGWLSVVVGVAQVCFFVALVAVLASMRAIC